MEPIVRLCRNIMDDNKDAVWKMCNTLDVALRPEDKEKKGKDLLKAVF